MNKCETTPTSRSKDVIDNSGKFNLEVQDKFSTWVKSIEGVIRRINPALSHSLDQDDYGSFLHQPSHSEGRIYESNFTYISINCGCCCGGFSSSEKNKNAGVLILVAAAVFAIFYDIIGLAVNKKNLETMTKLSGTLVRQMNDTVNESKTWKIAKNFSDMIEGYQGRVRQILKEARLAVIVNNGLKLATIAGSACVIIGGLLSVQAVLAIGVFATVTLIVYRIYDSQVNGKITDAYCNKLSDLSEDIGLFSKISVH